MRWLGLTLAVVMALSPAAWAQTRPATTKPAPSQPAAAADDVAAALRAREFAQAAERSQAALKQSPKDPRLWTLNGLALAGLGKRAEALRSFQRALASDPNNLAALEGAAQAHYEAGSQRAVPLLQRILKQRPDDPTAHAMLAVLAYRGGDCRAAVPHFERAGALLEAQLDALQAHATCLVRLRHGSRLLQEDPAAERHGLPDPVRVLQHLQSTQPLSAERSLLPWLRQGDQPAAAAVVAVRRPLHLLTASRPDV